MIKLKKNGLVTQTLKMDKRKKNLNPKDLPVLVHLAVVVKAKKVMILTINTVIKKMIKLNQNHRTKKIKQIVLKENEDRALEIGVDHYRDQSVVGPVQGIGVTRIQGVMIENLLVAIDQDAADHQCHVMEVPESIKASVIVLLVQMNQEALNIDISDNILVTN